MMREDLSSLTEGSLVVVCSGYGSSFSIAKIERVTKTQAIIGNRRFRLDDGGEVGADRYSRQSISVAPHLFLRAKKQKAADALKAGYPLDRDGVTRIRAAADYAEKVLREMGEWESHSLNATTQPTS